MLQFQNSERNESVADSSALKMSYQGIMVLGISFFIIIIFFNIIYHLQISEPYK